MGVDTELDITRGQSAFKNHHSSKVSKMPDLRAPTMTEILDAVKNISGKAIRSPLIKFQGDTNGIQAEIWLKLENLQPTGAFKVRPASNAIACISDKTRLTTAGVCTASAGNFAQGLAWCCKELGVSCTVVTPDTAPEIKLSAIRARGATVIKVPYSEWWKVIESHECPQAPVGSVFIHPGAENSVLAGNATVAMEIVEDLPDVDCIVAPYGSGALVTGIACGIRAMAENGRKELKGCQVLAVEPNTAAPFTISKSAGKAFAFDAWESSFVDGCGGKAVLEEIWEVAKDVIDGGIAVPLKDIAAAVKQLAEKNKVIAEGAGACPVAAALGGRCGPNIRKIVCVVSGGGLDNDYLASCLAGIVPRKVKGDADVRLEQLGLVLPLVPEPKGSYVPASIIGNLLYTAGHGPVKPDGKTYAVGRVGDDLSVEEGVQAARDTALAVIATLKHTLGSLDRVKRVVKTLGMVNVNPKTINHLECVQVVNGFSDLIISVFGSEAGVGPRSAVGVATLPMNTPVEVEVIFEIHP